MNIWRSVGRNVGVWRTSFSAAAAKAPHNALQAVSADLARLNRSTEEDFLRVGSKLVEVRSAARQISSDVAALDELISGPGSHDACRALEQMLEHSRAMDRRMAESGHAIDSVLDLSSRLRQAFAGLGHTVSIFRTICTLTRIETTRLGTAGVDFGNLAEEVKPLSEKIEASGQGVLDTVMEFDQGAQQARRKGSDLRASEIQALHSLIDSVLASLSAFEDRRRQAREVSARQISGYAAVGEAIEELVQSIQFHDITRQQVEHVIEALGELGAQIRTSGTQRMAAGHYRVPLSLQASQLAEAARTFTTSVARIESSLDDIGARLLEMAESSRALVGLADDDDQQSFFAVMETSLDSILKTVDACHGSEAEIGRVALELKRLADRMRESIADIRGTEISIERIAINATIRATQIGDAGNALNVVAEVMRRLALDSNGNTEEAATALESLAGAVSSMSEGGEDTDPLGLLGNTRAAIAELHSSSEESRRRVSQVATLGAGLADNLATIRRGFTAGRIFAATIERSRKALEAMGALDGSAAAANMGISTQRHLDRLAQTYTMQSQRDVHEAVVAGAVSGVVENPAPSGAQGSDDEPGGSGFGENVELF